MSFFDLLKAVDINEELQVMQKTEGAVLLDVRTREEYAAGHIPGSLNIPLDELHMAEEQIANQNTPLFVHCLSGGRSRQAVHFLKRLGYTNVTDAGGIQNYRGKTEKGVSR